MCAAVNEFRVPIIIDIEASGFGRGSYPIEVGFVLPDGCTQCTLITPDPSWTHWDDASESLHGISRELISRHGKPVDEVAAWLNRSLSGATVYSDAWGNDFSWLSLLFEYAEVPQKFHLEALNTLLTEGQMNGWADARNRVVAELDLKRHRASNDAKIIQMTYLATRPEHRDLTLSDWQPVDGYRIHG